MLRNDPKITDAKTESHERHNASGLTIEIYAFVSLLSWLLKSELTINFD